MEPATAAEDAPLPSVTMLVLSATWAEESMLFATVLSAVADAYLSYVVLSPAVAGELIPWFVVDVTSKAADEPL